jgi:uncharacterized protein
MDMVLHILGILVLGLVCLVALASLMFGLPGTFLIVVAALVYASVTGFAAVHWATIAWLLLLALLGEGIEFVAGAAGAAGDRPSRRVTLSVLAGGFAGGIVGAPFLFGVGSLLGALLGAFVSAVLAVASEGGDAGSALATGWAAMRGRLLGFVLKTAIAVVMLVVLAAAVL